MYDRQLFAAGSLQPLSYGRDVTSFVPREFESKLFSIRDHVKHAAISDIHYNGAQSFDFNRLVEMNGEGRHIAEGNASYLSIRNFSLNFDQPGRRIQLEP